MATSEEKRMMQATGTTVDWASENPILPKGLWAYDETADNWKWGNGTDAWNDRPYVTESVSPGPTLNPIFIDTFDDRSVASGDWGNTTTGAIAWDSTGDAARYQVDSTTDAAIIQGNTTTWPGTASSGGQVLPALNVQDIDLRTSFSLDINGPSTAHVVRLSGRNLTGHSNYYAATVSMNAVDVKFGIVKIVSGSETILTNSGTFASVRGTPYVADEIIHIRFQCQNINPTDLRAKVWFGSSTEPGSWNYEITDSTAGFQTTGDAGLFSMSTGTVSQRSASFYSVSGYPFA